MSRIPGRDYRQQLAEEEPWRQQFPYHWDADEAVTRREFVRFAVLTSGALFVGTVVLGILGKLDSRKRTKRQLIMKVGELEPGHAKYFHYPNSGDQAMILRLNDGSYAAYSQKCTHLSCAVYYQPKENTLHCPCHEGYFDPVTGEPTAGPPQRRLPRITVEEQGGNLYATEMNP
ncbi:Rieske 2Fe-2S domain-containing protein [bacterium]|nr:Rieske 2Fe-2S domain-containing protein [bacterium]